MKHERSNELETYTVRRGTDGKMGIYLRAYNVRCATFNANTETLQRTLGKLFDQAAGIYGDPRPVARRPGRRHARVHET